MTIKPQLRLWVKPCQISVGTTQELGKFQQNKTNVKSKHSEFIKLNLLNELKEIK